MLDEGFNQLKLWPEVRRRMKFQPDETLVGGEVWQHEAMRARMCVDAQVCHCGFFACRNRGTRTPQAKSYLEPEVCHWSND